MANTTLTSAKKFKKDEFYTQLKDIEDELRHYKDQFRDKVVYCNCDDPFESNFFKYFAANFNALGLQKLITTSYAKSPIAGSQLPLLELEGLKPQCEDTFKIEINEVPDLTADGATGLPDVEWLLKHDANVSTPLQQAGDFRSAECIELLKEADIVVTNPPFSLFREYIAQLTEYNKKFLIIGNKNAITYKECFGLIKENKMWLGYRNINSDMWLEVPEGEKYEKIVDGKRLKHIMACWYTNLETTKRHEEFIMYKKYSREYYPEYDNYSAINVNVVAEIPLDYPGPMGVPITYLDKYNPEQFEIMSSNDIRKNDKVPFKQHGLIKDKDAAINGKPTYVRIVIRNRKAV